VNSYIKLSKRKYLTNERYKMKKLIAIFCLVAVSSFATGVNAQWSKSYTKCKTMNGNIIVVEGTSCPTGTTYVGPG